MISSMTPPSLHNYAARDWPTAGGHITTSLATGELSGLQGNTVRGVTYL